MANAKRKSTETKRVKGNDAREATAGRERKRIPVTGLERNVLTYSNLDPNFHYCTVNDVDNQLREYQESGYEFVKHAVKIGDDLIHADQEGFIRKRVGKHDDGTPMMGYLMRIKNEFYEADMAEYNKHIDATEGDIYRSLNDGEDGKYGHVKIGHGGKRRR